ncbi:DUF4179 domain-containing protein [Neobacillus novalis]|uniref:DUF4179 domain-containing protein n=1 Tax=Neobacillus novalis TaxID=220687 RepID=A0AA95MRD6_9BACI|nr:DUF4179 domain-containing protein [Neobacillus novalis]WHY86515.1 DUF4179 domain-containing protein [Neobacillus novalis]
MFNNFDKELNNILNEEKEIPFTVRQSLDKTYDSIRKQSKQKKRKFNRNGIIAVVASACLVVGLTVSNDNVKAGIYEFFNFHDKGIERAVNEGFTQDSKSVASDKNIKVMLDHYFSDNNKIGLSFQMVFKDKSLLDKGVEEVSLNYRIINGDGEYIDEFVSDKKKLHGTNKYISSIENKNGPIDLKAGTVQYDAVLDSNEGTIPLLKNAVIEVESVIFNNGDGEFKVINGNWRLKLGEHTKAFSNIEYAMKNTSSKVQVTSAIANPTSLNITFALDGVIENENLIGGRMHITDENGEKYQPNAFSMKVKDNQTIISTNFPVSSYADANRLKLVVEEIGETDLVKK